MHAVLQAMRIEGLQVHVQCVCERVGVCVCVWLLAVCCLVKHDLTQPL